MAAPLEVVGPRAGGAPLSYVLGELGTVDLQTVFAHFDGSGAAGDFRPTLTIRAQNGTILARLFPSETLAAGDTADVSYVPFSGGGGGCDCASETSEGSGLSDVILAASAVGLWKLDETSGTTAADSSGAGNDMTVPAGGYIAPTWGQPAMAPGTPAALFIKEPPGSDAGTRFSRTMTALTDNFSAGVWVSAPSLVTQASVIELIGQGSPLHSSSGWELILRNDNLKFTVIMNATFLASDNNYVDDTPTLVGFTRAAGVTTLYVNGLAQAATIAAAPTANTATWIGNDGHSTALTHAGTKTLSWAFLTDQPMSGADWLNLATGAAVPFTLPAGWVWTSNGAGGAQWAPP